MHPRWCRIFPSTIRRLLGWEAAANLYRIFGFGHLIYLDVQLRDMVIPGCPDETLVFGVANSTGRKSEKKNPKEASLLKISICESRIPSSFSGLQSNCLMQRYPTLLS